MYFTTHSRKRASHHHLYSNNESLSLVDEAFGTLPAPVLLPAKATVDHDAEPSNTVAQLADYVVRTVPIASSSNVQPPPATHELKNPIWEYEAIPSGHVELGNYVLRCLLYLLGMCMNLQFSTKSIMLILSFMIDTLAIPDATPWTTFPWRKMHTSFGKYNINVHHWPEGVPLPPINVLDLEGKLRGKPKNAPQRKVRTDKSVRGLQRDDLYVLALGIRSKEYPLHFKIYTGGLSTGEFILLHTICIYSELTDTLGV